MTESSVDSLDIDPTRVPDRIAIDANVLIRALEADDPKRSDDPLAPRCAAIFQLAERGLTRIILPTPCVAEWWVTRSGENPPSGEGLEHAPFHTKAAREFANNIGVQGITDVRKQFNLPKGYVKFDAMVLACAWAAKAKVLVTSDDADYSKLLALRSVPENRRIPVLTPEAFIESIRPRQLQIR